MLFSDFVSILQAESNIANKIVMESIDTSGTVIDKLHIT